MKYLLILISLNFSLLANSFYFEFDKKVEIVPKISTKTLNNDEIQEYTTTEGKTIKFKNEILVECNENSDCTDDFEELNIESFNKISHRFFLIKLNSNQDIFEYCQKLYNKEDIKSAHPNYLKERKKR